MSFRHLQRPEDFDVTDGLAHGPKSRWDHKRTEPAVTEPLPNDANRLEVRLHYPPDPILAGALAAAGLRRAGRIGATDVWVAEAAVDDCEGDAR